MKESCCAYWELFNSQRSRSKSTARLYSVAEARDKSLTPFTLQPIVPPSQKEAFQDLVKNPQHYTDLRPVKRNEQSPGMRGFPVERPTRRFHRNKVPVSP